MPNKKELFVFEDATWPPEIGLNKTYDEIGWQRWDFTVAAKSYGRIKCSFYPQQFEKTLYAYFTQMGSGKRPTSAKDVEAVDAKYPGSILTQVEHALFALESLLPHVIELSVALAGQKAIHCTLWDLNEVTHELGLKIAVADSFEAVLATANKIAHAGVKNLRGPRSRLTKTRIRRALRKLGPKATQSALARELGVTDRQIRNLYLPNEKFPAFRRRHS